MLEIDLEPLSDAEAEVVSHHVNWILKGKGDAEDLSEEIKQMARFMARLLAERKLLRALPAALKEAQASGLGYSPKIATFLKDLDGQLDRLAEKTLKPGLCC